MSDNVTLKPCPFCGGEAHAEFSPHFGIMSGRVVCLNAGHTDGMIYKTKAQAITAWNTRAEQSVPNSVVEAIRRVTSHIERYEGQTTFTIADWQLEELDRLTTLQSGQTKAELLREALEVIRENNPQEYLVEGGGTWGLHDDLIARIDTHLQGEGA